MTEHSDITVGFSEAVARFEPRDDSDAASDLLSQTGFAPTPTPDAFPEIERAPDHLTRKPLGQILVERGDVSADNLAKALALQVREDVRLGDILLAHGWVTQPALAERYNTVIADLAKEPPDVRLVDEIGVKFCIRNGVVPWKRMGNTTVLICSQPEEFARIATALPEGHKNARLAVAPEDELQSALIALRHRDLAGQAETLVDADVSCRTWRGAAAGRIVLALAISIVSLFVISPVLGFAVLTAWAVGVLAVTSAIKLWATSIHLHKKKFPTPPDPNITDTPGQRMPIVSVLVPLYKEREIAGRLVTRLSALDYPRELLDICLVVEEDDTLTQNTLARAELPRWMRQIIVPRGVVRTKPRAMNFALDFCRGSIIGIYDAEDMPDPDQITRIVNRFQVASPWVACLQGVLDFYNPRTNWLARMFTIEYAVWFRVVLPGMEKIGFAVPLGGTTVFFRRTALEALGGWDAHNVTEDADLGIRLARRGFRTELLHTVTREEANCRPWPWIKQRSRWIKGYAMTYGVHMRQPRKLIESIGWWRFIGVQYLFLGTLSGFALAPVLWSFWLIAFGLPHPLLSVMPGWMFLALAGTFVLSEAISIIAGVVAVSGPDHKHLRWWVPTLHAYFPLATFAAMKGLGEIISKPFYWDKTEHGHADQTREVVDMMIASAAPAE